MFNKVTQFHEATRFNKAAGFVLMMLISTPVYASWQFESISLNYFWLVTVPFFFVHLISTVVLYLKGDYRSDKVAYTHFFTALMFPFLGIVFLLYELFLDYEGNQHLLGDFILGLVVYVFLMLISALPLIIYRMHSE